MEASKPIPYPSRRTTLTVLVGLGALAVVSLALLIDHMGPMGDWWYVVAQFEDGTLPTVFQWDLTRPLVGLVWNVVWQIFGYHLVGWYVVMFGAMALSAMVLWYLLWRYLTVPWTVAALVAAFMLVYPSDTAREYIVALTNRHAILCCLLTIWAWLVAGSAKDRRLVILGSTLCAVFSTITLLLYEGPLGVMLILPFVIFAVQLRSVRVLRPMLKQWRRIAVWYIGPALFAFYRLVLEPRIPEVIKPQLLELTFSPDRILQQLSYFPATTLWKGWLYAFVALTRVESKAFLVIVIGLIVAACFLLYRQMGDISGRFYRYMLLSGILLLAASAFPIVISTLDVSIMVGTLFSRTLSTAAFGNALIVVGILGWLSTRSRALGAVFSAILLSLAVAESIGLQYIYVDVWRNQLRVVEALKTYAPHLPDGSTVLLLDLPSNPYETRYAFPYTRLVRVFYGNKTLQAAPWLAGYPPDQQLVAFGQKSLVVVETLDHMATINRPYEGTVALRYNPDGPMTLVQTIDQRYLLPANTAWFVAPDLVSRHEAFQLAPPAEGSTTIATAPFEGDILTNYCQRLLASCQRH